MAQEEIKIALKKMGAAKKSKAKLYIDYLAEKLKTEEDPVYVQTYKKISKK